MGKHSTNTRASKRYNNAAIQYIDMDKLKQDRVYFLDAFNNGRIGVSYMFTPMQIEWLEIFVGEDWNKKFAASALKVLVKDLSGVMPLERPWA